MMCVIHTLLFRAGPGVERVLELHGYIWCIVALKQYLGNTV